MAIAMLALANTLSIGVIGKLCAHPAVCTSSCVHIQLYVCLLHAQRKSSQQSAGITEHSRRSPGCS
jgi:hypothetical protein